MPAVLRKLLDVPAARRAESSHRALIRSAAVGVDVAIIGRFSMSEV
jgi:hypothetical protein